MDRKKFIIIIAAFVFSLAFIEPVSYLVGANSQQTAAAGSREDPLVTASYVEKYISDILEAQADMSDAQSYELITLSRNQRIRAKSGTLELILRPGSRARVTAPGSDINNVGIPDLTSGNELIGGDIISANHLLLIPRADRRGLVILSETAYILVRGDYEIE